MSTNHLDTIRMMVSIGMGWSVLPQTLLDSSIVCIKMSSWPIHQELGCVWHQQRSLSNAAISFLDMVYSQFDHLASSG
jgi:DNA-binding transcriptional LysR family regulator